MSKKSEEAVESLVELVMMQEQLIATLEAERDALQADSQRYEYLLDCDVKAAVHYLPRLDAEKFKATRRATHDAAISKGGA